MTHVGETHHPIPQDVSLLPVLRELTDCYLHVERTSARLAESMGMTHSQFDVIATLGDTEGLTCKAIGNQSFITKGTLTPVLGRLEARGLVRRWKGTEDCRQTFAALTDEGQRLYEQTFMAFVDALRPRFDILTPDEQAQLIGLLRKLKPAFT